MKRKKTRVISVGNVKIGGSNDIVVQSMTNTKTEDFEKTVLQIKELEKVGCEIIRVAVPSEEAAKNIRKIKDSISIPLIADIHFNYRLALKSIENGADAIRINPGNIGSIDRVKKIIDSARMHNISIRIGVNGGSLEKDILKKYGEVSSDALVESALRNIKIFEKQKFYNLKISIKVSDVLTTINAYKKISELTDYPLHIGVTEAGTIFSGSIKSALGVGILLYEGIGDTIRVSLTGNPVNEVIVAYKILNYLGIRKRGVEIISCPTCGRTDINVLKIAESLEQKLAHIDKYLKVAVMGCVVNGPGEAKEADIGIAGGKGVGLIFKKGEIFKKVKESELENELINEINELVK
jgi:(E)-4-hydroxy-3-methylbut-2-enyl-diphosphate synthase